MLWLNYAVKLSHTPYTPLPPLLLPDSIEKNYLPHLTSLPPPCPVIGLLLLCKTRIQGGPVPWIHVFIYSSSATVNLCRDKNIFGKRFTWENYSPHLQTSRLWTLEQFPLFTDMLIISPSTVILLYRAKNSDYFAISSLIYNAGSLISISADPFNSFQQLFAGRKKTGYQRLDRLEYFLSDLTRRSKPKHCSTLFLGEMSKVRLIKEQQKCCCE